MLSYHISKWLLGLKRECAPAVALGADSTTDSYPKKHPCKVLSSSFQSYDTSKCCIILVEELGASSTRTLSLGDTGGHI